MDRTAGILLHVTSLPGPYGIGDLGPIAHRWIDTLAEARQTWWQVLPLVPAGAGDSPYAGASAFAGNPLLVSPESLIKDGLLRWQDLPNARFTEGRVDYRKAERFKRAVLHKAWDRFQAGSGKRLASAFEAFRSGEREWLDDYALFAAIKERNGAGDWTHWPKDLVRRKPAALAAAHRELRDAVERHQFIQFLFARQMDALRAHARKRKVKLIGDLPIFVSFDSADVWAHSAQFQLDRDFQPKVVAGVPPDYFSKTGQRWGNPHYDWKRMEANGFRWWVERVRATLNQVDLVRLDHFRGFDASWAVPADCPTAVKGRWMPVPGAKLFETFRKQLGHLPFIAEDLGLITPGVEKLRDEFALPGMRVLQFAFGGGGADNPFLPHNYPRHAVAYTGTHDNDTTAGWYRSLKPPEKQNVHRYAPEAIVDAAGAMMRLAWGSVAALAIAPLQDVLRLGTSARMNMPGKADGNWGWRATERQMGKGALDELGELTAMYSRCEHAPAGATAKDWAV